MASQIFLTTLLQQTADVANRFNDYLVLGYFAMWIVAMVYIISLVMRQRNLKQDLQLMQQILQEDEK